MLFQEDCWYDRMQDHSPDAQVDDRLDIQVWEKQKEQSKRYIVNWTLLIAKELVFTNAITELTD